MRHPVAWIRKHVEGYSDSNYNTSHEGFERRGWEVRRYDLLDEVTLQEGDVLHGPVGDIRRVLPSVHVSDYPDELRNYMQRRAEASTLGAAKRRFEHESLFIKPRFRHKCFTGRVVEGPLQAADLSQFSDDLEVWVSEPVEFASEWRVYVCSGQIFEISRYVGQPTAFPDGDTVARMVGSVESPVCYGMDVGVEAATGETTLVEMNHAFCLGNYGLHCMRYAEMIEVAWEEAWKENWVDESYIGVDNIA